MSEFRINDELFIEFANDTSDRAAYRLAARLGGLARWVLCDAVLAAAARCWETLGQTEEAEYLRKPPRSTPQPGACGVLFVQNPRDRFSALRPAFALPVRWERISGVVSGADIPPGLRGEAESVLRLLDDGPVRFVGHWRLRLAVDDTPDRYDLSGWSAVGGGSAWGILTAAVLTAGYGVPNDPTVWASVAWDPVAREPKRVEGIVDKLTEAARLGARQVFVARDQNDATGDNVVRLEGPGDSPDVWLRSLCVALASRPAAISAYRGEDERFFEDASRYHNLLTGLRQASRARDYYRAELLQPIAARCAGQLPQARPATPRLVTFLSESSELVELGAAIHQPARVLVLHTPETEPRSAEERERLAVSIRQAAGQPDCMVEFLTIASDTLPGGLPETVRLFALAEDPPDVTVDLTPGPKPITLALYADLAFPGVRFTYLHTHRRPNAAAIRYGTERLIVLPTTKCSAIEAQQTAIS